MHLEGAASQMHVRNKSKQPQFFLAWTGTGQWVFDTGNTGPDFVAFY